jgi:hypothetical protein
VTDLQPSHREAHIDTVNKRQFQQTYDHLAAYKAVQVRKVKVRASQLADHAIRKKCDQPKRDLQELRNKLKAVVVQCSVGSADIER